MEGLWDAIWGMLQPVLQASGAALQGQLTTLAIGSLLMVVWVGSAALAATVAELRGRHPLGHFFLGLLVPGVYPLVIHLTLKAPGEEEEVVVKKEDKTERQEGAPPVEAAPTSRVGSLQALVTDNLVKEQGAGYNEAYFRGIQRDSQGNPRGPFELMVAGNPLRAQRIAQVQNALIVIETVNQEGKTQTLRIPFEKIESCREL